MKTLDEPQLLTQYMYSYVYTYTSPACNFIKHNHLKQKAKKL